MICKRIVCRWHFLNKSEFICLHTVKWFQVLPYNNSYNNSGVMVIVVGNGHGDTSSNPRRDWLHFT